jgi:TPR repeat protein
VLAKLIPAGLILLAPIAARADIHDEMHACIHERLQQLKKAGFQASSAADQFCIGYGYWQARLGLPHDPAKSAEWFAKAAAQGHPGAQTVLAYHYEQGHGVAKNYAEAVRLLRLALNQNYPDAMFHMGRLYTTGKGVPRNSEMAVQYFQKAAAAGSADGIIAIRQQRDYDLTAPARQTVEAAYQAFQAKDYARAAALYRTAADAGNPQAQTNLGTMLRIGQGVPKDEAAAIALYRKAAAKGWASAQAQLGFAYEMGDGVPKDWKQAYQWCNQSARQFDKLGLFCLGRMYHFGIGVAQDRQRAYRIYDRAEDAGDGMSKFFASWLRVKQNCVGFRSEEERQHYTDVCQDPAGIAFASEQQRVQWLTQRQAEANRAALAAWGSSGGFGSGACGAAGGSWGGGGCMGDGGRIFDPMQQDRYGRNLW